MGVKDARHASHYTKASSSHIRMVLREEGLALGAKDGIENFGLDAFQGLLGRLNGKSEETLRKEENVRREVQMMMRRERRVGSILFISGGYLRMDEEKAKNTADNAMEPVESKDSPNNYSRKAAQRESLPDPAFQSKGAKRKRKTPASEKTDESVVPQTDTTEAETPTEKKASKRKLKKSIDDGEKREPNVVEATINVSGKSKKKKNTWQDDTHGLRDARVTTDLVDGEYERKKRRAERRKDRAERRARKEARRMKKIGASSDTSSQAVDNKVEREGKSSELNVQDPASIHNENDELQSPSAAQSPMPAVRARGRHLLRQKYIQQKNMAAADQTALNEVRVCFPNNDRRLTEHRFS